MDWHKITIPYDRVNSETVRIQSAFKQAVETVYSSNLSNISLYIDRETNEDEPVNFYFSPSSYIFARKIIESYNWSTCEKPDSDTISPLFTIC